MFLVSACKLKMHKVFVNFCCRLSQFWQISLRTHIASARLRPLAKKMSKLFSWSWLSFRTTQKLLNFLCSLLTNTSLVAEGIWLVTSNYTVVVNNCNVDETRHSVSQFWNLIWVLFNMHFLVRLRRLEYKKGVQVNIKRMLNFFESHVPFLWLACFSSLPL